MTDAQLRHRLALDFVAGLVDGDVERMRAALHAEATWTVPGRTAISGLAAGATAVVERARTITSGGDVSIELHHVLEGWDNAAVLLHNTGARGPAVLDEQVVIAFTFTDDKIRTAENLISDVRGLDTFFAASERT